MIRVFLHVPKHASDAPDYELESPSLIKWWDAENIVGGSCLVPAHELADIIERDKSDSVKHIVAALRAFEEAHVARVDRLL